MEEPCDVKFSAFPIYRFFRNELPALTKAALVCIVLFGISAFVIFSPGFSMRPLKKDVPAPAPVSVAEGYENSGAYRDSEPLFLPTARNFGADVSPEALRLREKSFLPFGGLLSIDLQSAELSLRLQNEQIPPLPENAFGADSWEIAKKFALGETDSDAEKIAAANADRSRAALRIADAETASIVYSAPLATLGEYDNGQTLFAPAEYFCDIAFPAGTPRVFTVHSCGNAELDAKISAEAAEILRKHVRRCGLFRIFADGL